MFDSELSRLRWLEEELGSGWRKSRLGRDLGIGIF
jgi:hypothetical protein